MPKHISYPEIGQFRNAIHQVTTKARQIGVDATGEPIFDHAKPLPTLTYEGTVKLHGTNAAIGVIRKSPLQSVSKIWFQSRENIINLEKDNAGFVRNFQDKEFWTIFDNIIGNEIIIFGEWCGGNIQPNVALTNLPKRFVVFGAKVDGAWLHRDAVAKIKNEAIGVENIYDFYTERVKIDFSFPQLSQNILADLTEKVEAECPFAKAHGVSGVGEGIVWKCIDEGWEDPMFYFKVKGNAHSVTKVKTLAAVDIEKVNSYREFAEKCVTENRCRQGVDKLREAGKPTDRKSLGDFLKWVQTDIEKEESDTAKASGLDLKAASGEITKTARNWFFKNETSF